MELAVWCFSEGFSCMMLNFILHDHMRRCLERRFLRQMLFLILKIKMFFLDFFNKMA